MTPAPLANRKPDGDSVLAGMTTIQGKLQLIGNLSFIQPAGCRLIMRDTPPGGNFNQRAAAATALLTQRIGAANGSSVSVTGDPDPVDMDVFLVDSAI